MKTREEMFEDYLCRKGDCIDNAAYQLIVALLRTDDTTNDEDVFGWSMETIAEITDAAEAILCEKGLKVCRPAYVADKEDGDCETPCCFGECPYAHLNCPLKKE